MTNPDPAPTTPPPARRPDSRRRAPVVAGVLVGLAAAGALTMGAIRGIGEPAAAPGPAAASTPAPTADPTAAAAIADVQRREADDPFALGRPDAKVVLVEFSDWRCPFCALWARQTKPALQTYIDDGTLRIEYRDLPIFGEESHLAAKAGRAAGAQGRFWEFYDAVFAAAPERGHPDLDVEKLVGFAKQAGVPDLETFEKQVTGEDPTITTQIERDVADARRLGAPNSVPLFLVGNEALSGAQPTEVFVQAVERQAAAAS